MAVPRPPKTAALGVPGERRGAVAALGDRGAWKGALPGTACWAPGIGGDHDKMETTGR